MAGKISSDQVPANVLSLIEEQIKEGGGQNFYFSGGTFLSTFEGPTKAVRCSLGLANFLKSLSVKESFAIDMKVGSSRRDQIIDEVDKENVNAILETSAFDGVMVTQAVKYLLSGVDLNFKPHTLDFRDRKILVFEVIDSDEIEDGNIKAKSIKEELLLEKILEVIRLNFTNESFGVDELCKEIGVGERQLQRKLKAITNKSPIQLILSVKLHHAKKMLLDGSYAISEVAYQSGFNNPSYFSKCFKKEFGSSPSAVQ